MQGSQSCHWHIKCRSFVALQLALRRVCLVYLLGAQLMGASTGEAWRPASQGGLPHVPPPDLRVHAQDVPNRRANRWALTRLKFPSVSSSNDDGFWESQLTVTSASPLWSLRDASFADIVDSCFLFYLSPYCSDALNLETASTRETGAEKSKEQEEYNAARFVSFAQKYEGANCHGESK